MSLAELLATVPRPGRLAWIGLRTAYRGPIESVRSVEAAPGLGLRGDRRAERAGPSPRSARQVTLVQAEHLAVIGALLGTGPVDPVLLRRNLVIEGVNLRALYQRRFRVGEVVLEGAGECHPCSRMEEALGPGGYQAVRGHGGLNARVIEGGVLRVGDPVDLITEREAPMGEVPPLGGPVS
jgi:MOSC domain-containing protein YiiM